jgi:3-oxoacyl-[acyl-carrier-protein] synthase-3
MRASIEAIECYFPQRTLTNEELAARFPEWPAEKIEEKTGIATRHIAAEEETSGDLGYEAARRLLDSGACAAAEVDFLIFCTQSPDYFLPATACVLQRRLGLPVTAGALDLNQGCSGWVYGLSLARGLIESGQARRVLLVTAETYSKFMHPDDKGCRTVFGDGAAATLVAAAEEGGNVLGEFIFGTDGRGEDKLIVRTGAFRRRAASGEAPGADAFGNLRSPDYLYMNGPEIFHFTLRAVPQAVEQILAKAGLGMDGIDVFLLHQANRYMLDHLRRKLGIPEEKFVTAMRDYGNTVSSTMPVALRDWAAAGKLKAGDRILLAGFGVGYSWAAGILTWGGSFNFRKS